MAKPTQKPAFVSGVYKKHFSGKEFTYQSFLPSPINTPYSPKDRRVFTLLEEATQHLSELNAYSRLVPDIDFFISMHVRNEALKSSKIEGTNTNMNEAVLEEKEIVPERRDDWKEVQNHIAATNHGIKQLKKLPVCMRLLCDAHKILLRGARGEEKQPGNIRKTQNWIGGVNIASASFVPPHPDDLSDTLKDLENFWHNKNLLTPNLLMIAMSHYQFETIHPLNDGNGRIGRILIVLHLIEIGMLEKPVLYLSDFFEKHKGKYYEALTLVREQNDMDQWLLFFLSGIIETSKKGKEILRKMVDLREKYEHQIMEIGRQTKTANELLLLAFSNPAFDTATASKKIGTSVQSVNTTVKRLVDAGILKEITGHSRNRIFVLHEYLGLF